MSKLVPVEEAIETILEFTKATSVEEVPLMEALGRAVAADLSSDVDINGFDDAAMDGFAIIAADIEGASPDNPVELEVVDTVGAGYLYQGTLQRGKAVRIMTGAAMPDGADSNIKWEDVQVTGGGVAGGTVIFTSPCKPGTNVRKAGEEARAGQKVFSAGDVVNAAGVGLLATTGNVSVPVHRRPRVGVMSIGTELVDSSTVPGMGMKRDSNRYTLAAMAREAGAEVTMYPIVPDDYDEIRKVYLEMVAQNDVVVSSGGACGGDFDFITQVIASVSDIKFEYVNMKPGKAQTFGVTEDGKLLFGLSGNPAASATGFEVLVRPALLKMQGRLALERPVVKARLGRAVKKKGGRRFLLRGRVERAEDGGLVATPNKNQSSAVIGATSESNCFIVLPEGEYPVEEGMEVVCIRVDLPEGSVI